MLEILSALLGVIPKWVYASLATLLLACSCTLQLHNSSLQAKVLTHEKTIANLESSIADSRYKAAQESSRLERKAREAEQAGHDREIALSNAYAGARNELDRLRVLVSKTTGSATGLSDPSKTDYTDPYAELFLDCAGRYAAMGAKADGHANDVRTLIDAWPTGK